MPAHKKPPRLWVRKRPGRTPYWIISDGPMQISTGVLEADRDEAERVFREYLQGKPQVAAPIINGRARPVRTREVGTIYFASCSVEDFPIKIGFATNLAARMAKMQVHLPYPIAVLGTLRGTVRRERDLHTGFAHIWLRGEWFQRTEELVMFINENCEPAYEAVAATPAILAK